MEKIHRRVRLSEALKEQQILSLSIQPESCLCAVGQRPYKPNKFNYSLANYFIDFQQNPLRERHEELLCRYNSCDIENSNYVDGKVEQQNVFVSIVQLNQRYVKAI